VASHHLARPKVVAAVLGVGAALSAVALEGAGLSTVPTALQITLALVGSAIAGCLAARTEWPTAVRPEKNLRGTV
jgi:hypothetical protein